MLRKIYMTKKCKLRTKYFVIPGLTRPAPALPELGQGLDPGESIFFFWIPAFAGMTKVDWIPAFAGMTKVDWIPAFAGMTINVNMDCFVAFAPRNDCLWCHCETEQREVVAISN
jgi:hypothetical protein